MDFLNEYKVFRGSVVCSGNAVMSVQTIGDGSVYGQIAGELQQDDERDTPLKVKSYLLTVGGMEKNFPSLVLETVILLYMITLFCALNF